MRKPTKAEVITKDLKRQSNKTSYRKHKSRSRSRERNLSSRGLIDPVVGLSGDMNNWMFRIFSPFEDTTTVVALDEPIKGKIISEKYRNIDSIENITENPVIGEPLMYKFDDVIDENFRKDKLYSKHIKDIVKRCMNGENAIVTLFGPSEDNRNGLLKYNSSKEKGILGRSLEDILKFSELYDYTKFSISVNVCQIYLECIEDLL